MVVLRKLHKDDLIVCTVRRMLLARGCQIMFTYQENGDRFILAPSERLSAALESVRPDILEVN